MAARSTRFEERTNDYFLDGEGISREVIQADICRYLGNDALVRPTTHQGRHGYIITAYRNLTSHMIADLKADSARWEQDVSRRAEQGFSRGSYNPGLSPSQSPNNTPGNYAQSSIRDVRQPVGPSPVYTSAQPSSFEPVYSQPPPTQYASVPSTQGYSMQQQYPPNPGYGQTPNPYPQSQSPYSSSSQNQPPISAPDMHSQAYTHHGGPGYQPYPEGGRPRYDEFEHDYPPVTSGMPYAATAGMPYPPTTAPDGRYQPDIYQEQARGQQPRDRDPHRRGR